MIRNSKEMTKPKVLTSVQCKNVLRILFWVLVIICIIVIILSCYKDVGKWLNYKLYRIQKELILTGMRN